MEHFANSNSNVPTTRIITTENIRGTSDPKSLQNKTFLSDLPIVQGTVGYVKRWSQMAKLPRCRKTPVSTTTLAGEAAIAQGACTKSLT